MKGMLKLGVAAAMAATARAEDLQWTREGQNEDGKDVYVMHGGTHRDPWGAILGNHGTGGLTISGGVWDTDDALETTVLGNRAGSLATVIIKPGGTFNAGNLSTIALRVGNEGCGEIYNHGTLSVSKRGCEIGYANTAGPASKIHHLAGMFSVAGDLFVGVHGRGALMAEESLSSRSLCVAVEPDSRGCVELREGALYALAANQPVVIGKQGFGELVMRGGLLQGSGVSARLSVREAEDACGVIRGWGKVEHFVGGIINNGLVIADGEGEDRELAFTGFDFLGFGHYFLGNTIPNTTTNGWYARNGGKLRLPGFYLDGPGDYPWGEAPWCQELGLVNSVRVKFDAVEGVHVFLDVDILAPDRTDLPALPNKESAIGIWRVYFPGAENNTLVSELEVRYDHVAADGAIPELHQHNPSTGEWKKLATKHLDGHRLMATGFETFRDNGAHLGHIVAIRPY